MARKRVQQKVYNGLIMSDKKYTIGLHQLYNEF